MSTDTLTDRDNRPITYEEDGRVVYRASGVGTCSKVLVASRLGLTPLETPEWLEEKYQQGTDGESRVVEIYQDETRDEIVDQQREVEVGVGARVVIRGHIDGVTRDDPRVVEIKCLSAGMAEQFERHQFRDFPYYGAQVGVYMETLGLPLLILIGVKDDEGKVARVLRYTFRKPPVPVWKIKAKVAKVEAQVARSQVPELCDTRVYPCPYYYLHGDEDKVRVEVENAELDELIVDYTMFRETEKKAKLSKEETLAEINRVLDANGWKAKKVVTARFEYADVVQAGRRKLNMAKVQAAGVDLDPYYDIAGEVRFGKVKSVKVKEKGETGE